MLPWQSAHFKLFGSQPQGQRRTLLAAAIGWALDAFDAMLYSLVLAMLMRDLGMSKTTAGSLGTLTLLASGIGGLLFGFLADRIGRKHALMASILTYSVCSFASGLATSVAMLAAARFVLGLGMGGEWNTGATLVAESWPTELRAKAISLVQSSWALGFALAALVAGPVSRYYGWRAVFFVGILPALVTLWIQRSVPESEMWREQTAEAKAQLTPDDVRGSDKAAGFPDGGLHATSLKRPSSGSSFGLRWQSTQLLYSCSTFLECLGGGDCSRGCRLIFRFQSTRADADLESWA